MASSGACLICGAPQSVGSPCKYCGFGPESGVGTKGGDVLPPELAEVLEHILARQSDCRNVIDYLALGLKSMVPSSVSASKPLFGGSITRLTARLGPTIYTFAPRGAACVVTKEAAAAGMRVGMTDQLGPSQWPEMFVWDLGRFAERSGLGWRALPRYFQ